MNWDAIGAIAEALSAIAVLLTLVYLSFQVRDTRKQLRLNSHQARTDRNIKLHLARSGDADYQDIVEMAFRGEQLSDKQYEKLFGHWAAAMRHFEDLHYQYHAGAIDEETWEANQGGLRRVMSLPWSKLAWEKNQVQFRKTFREVIDQIMAEQD